MNWFAWTIYLMAVGAVVVALLPRRLECHSRVAALIFALGALVCGFIGVTQLENPAQVAPIVKLSWIPAFGFEFFLGADGISAVMVLLTGIASIGAILFSWNIEYRPRAFFAFFLLLVCGVYGVFLSFDLFLLFVFYELAIIPKYFLIAIWGSTRKEYGAMKLVMYSFVGSALVLFGLVALYVSAKTAGINPPLDLTRLHGLHLTPQAERWLFLLFFVGFGILAGLWPFHSWAPTGHVAAPTGASMLLAGIIMKLGAYGALRTAVSLFPEATLYWQPLFAFLAAIAIVYAAGVALVQTDFKFVIGYSSVSHMGFVLLGLVTLTDRGLSGAVLQMFSHGLLAGILFGVVGRMVYDRVHTREFAQLQKMQLGNRMPAAAAIFAIGSIAAMGIPGFSGFVAELNVILGALASIPWTVGLVLIGILLGAGYLWRAYTLAFVSEGQEGVKREPLTAAELTGSVLLLGTSFIVGVYPSILLRFIEPAISKLVHAS